MIRPLLSLALLLAASAALAAEPPRPAWEGAWQGTIGTLPVQACLAQHGGSWASGSYYYLSKRAPLPLQRETDGSWSEHPVGQSSSSGSWTIRSADAGQISGEWRSGTRSLPIALTRLPAGDAIEGGPCGSDAYLGPLLRPVRIVERPRTAAGIAFTELTYDVGPYLPDVSIVSFALPLAQPGDARINAVLRLDPTKFEGEADYRSCLRGALSGMGDLGDFHFGYRPALVTRTYVSAAGSSDGFCGGAHPWASQWHRLFDRRTGREIDLRSWFTARAVPPRLPDDAPYGGEIKPALRAVALRHYRFADSDCRAAVSEADYWDLALEARGIAFTPDLPHVAQACADSVTVPFAELRPFLSAEGRAGAARVN